MPKNGWMLASVCAWLLLALTPGFSAPQSPVVRAGTNYTVTKWDTDTEDGLPNNVVIAMTQTRDGYLWLGTLNGLVRFDGLHFTVFDEHNTPGLNSGRIVCLFEDSRHNLWIGTETAGVAILKDGQVSPVLETGSGDRERSLAAICEDAEGTVWLYLANGDVWRCQEGQQPRPFGQPRNPSRTHALIAENPGPVWIGADRLQRGIGRVSSTPSLVLPLDESLDVPVTNRLSFLLASQHGGYWRLADGLIRKYRTNQIERELAPYPWSSGATVTAACEDRQGNLVVGTLGAGLFWFDSEGNATSLSTNQGLSHNFILSVLVDREGALWVGTDGGGLNRVKRQVFDVLDETRDLVVQSASPDGEGGLWIGYNNGGITHWREDSASRHDMRKMPVFSVLVEPSRTAWAGTAGLGLWQLANPSNNGRFQFVSGPMGITAEITALHQDRHGILWMGTRGGLLRHEGSEWQMFTTSNGLPSDAVRAIADDAEGNLWIGTAGGGLARLRDGAFSTFHKTDGLPSEDISSVFVDAEGVLWVGTVGSGLGRFHAGKWSRFTTSEGLVSNNLGYLIEDGHGYLWIGSNRGLMRARKKALNDFALGLAKSVPLRAYGRPDGMPTRECTSGSQPGACSTPDGKLWFPTIKGLAFIDPFQLHPNTNPPPVIIQSVLIDGQPQNTNALRLNWPSEITVPAGKEHLEIHYTSLNLAAAERARFRYRLEGRDTAWTEVGNIREVHYPKLDPGHYVFRVAACNEDGVWNESGASLSLILEPPFWSRWWFRPALAASLLGAISGAVYYVSTQRLRRQLERLRQQEALEKERARIARDIHDQLGASLTQVTLLGEFVESDKDSPSDVEAHARQICQTARDTTRVLDEIVWTVNPSNDTLDGLVTYICKYAQDYLAVAGVRYRLDVPVQLPARSLPPELRHNVFLAAKEAITNVVRHAKASAALIRLKLEPRAFILEIEDNGRGLGGLDEKAAATRNGLRNMRKRMEDIGGAFTMTAAPEGGALIRLSAPLPPD